MTLAIDRTSTQTQESLASQGIPTVAGASLRVPLVTGGDIGYANLDHAASAPCLDAVRVAVDEFLPWYASVHRGAGFASQVSTKLYERTRATLRSFVGARRTDTVVFTRNTTDSFNLLARSLPPRTAVIVFDTEHHAALLPWQGPNVRRLPTPRTRLAAVSAVDEALAESPQGPRLVVLTGASNVTGELLPVAEIAAVAQPARRPHRPRRRPARAAPQDRHAGPGRRLRRPLRPQAVRALRRGRADRPRRLAARRPALPRRPAARPSSSPRTPSSGTPARSGTKPVRPTPSACTRSASPAKP